MDPMSREFKFNPHLGGQAADRQPANTPPMPPEQPTVPLDENGLPMGAILPLEQGMAVRNLVHSQRSQDLRSRACVYPAFFTQDVRRHGVAATPLSLRKDDDFPHDYYFEGQGKAEMETMIETNKFFVLYTENGAGVVRHLLEKEKCDDELADLNQAIRPYFGRINFNPNPTNEPFDCNKILFNTKNVKKLLRVLEDYKKKEIDEIEKINSNLRCLLKQSFEQVDKQIEQVEEKTLEQVEEKTPEVERQDDWAAFVRDAAIFFRGMGRDFVSPTWVEDIKQFEKKYFSEWKSLVEADCALCAKRKTRRILEAIKKKGRKVPKQFNEICKSYHAIEKLNKECSNLESNNPLRLKKIIEIENLESLLKALQSSSDFENWINISDDDSVNQATEQRQRRNIRSERRHFNNQLILKGRSIPAVLDRQVYPLWLVLKPYSQSAKSNQQPPALNQEHRKWAIQIVKEIQVVPNHNREVPLPKAVGSKEVKPNFEEEVKQNLQEEVDNLQKENLRKQIDSLKKKKQTKEKKIEVCAELIERLKYFDPEDSLSKESFFEVMRPILTKTEKGWNVFKIPFNSELSKIIQTGVKKDLKELVKEKVIKSQGQFAAYLSEYMENAVQFRLPKEWRGIYVQMLTAFNRRRQFPVDRTKWDKSSLRKEAPVKLKDIPWWKPIQKRLDKGLLENDLLNAKEIGGQYLKIALQAWPHRLISEEILKVFQENPEFKKFKFPIIPEINPEKFKEFSGPQVRAVTEVINFFKEKGNPLYLNYFSLRNDCEELMQILRNPASQKKGAGLEKFKEICVKRAGINLEALPLSSEIERHLAKGRLLEEAKLLTAMTAVLCRGLSITFTKKELEKQVTKCWTYIVTVLAKHEPHFDWRYPSEAKKLEKRIDTALNLRQEVSSILPMVQKSCEILSTKDQAEWIQRIFDPTLDLEVKEFFMELFNAETEFQKIGLLAQYDWNPDLYQIVSAMLITVRDPGSFSKVEKALKSLQDKWDRIEEDKRAYDRLKTDLQKKSMVANAVQQMVIYLSMLPKVDAEALLESLTVQPVVTLVDIQHGVNLILKPIKECLKTGVSTGGFRGWEENSYQKMSGIFLSPFREGKEEEEVKVPEYEAAGHGWSLTDEDLSPPYHQFVPGDSFPPLYPLEESEAVENNSLVPSYELLEDGFPPLYSLEQLESVEDNGPAPGYEPVEDDLLPPYLRERLQGVVLDIIPLPQGQLSLRQRLEVFKLYFEKAANIHTLREMSALIVELLNRGLQLLGEIPQEDEATLVKKHAELLDYLEFVYNQLIQNLLGQAAHFKGTNECLDADLELLRGIKKELLFLDESQFKNANLGNAPQLNSLFSEMRAYKKQLEQDIQEVKKKSRTPEFNSLFSEMRAYKKQLEQDIQEVKKKSRTRELNSLFSEMRAYKKQLEQDIQEVKKKSRTRVALEEQEREDAEAARIEKERLQAEEKRFQVERQSLQAQVSIVASVALEVKVDQENQEDQAQPIDIQLANYRERIKEYRGDKINLKRLFNQVSSAKVRQKFSEVSQFQTHRELMGEINEALKSARN